MKNMKSPDAAETADEKPPKRCEWVGDYSKERCPNDAVCARFARVDARVNPNGVHVTTKARLVFVCEEHADSLPAVPDQEATVKQKDADVDPDEVNL